MPGIRPENPAPIPPNNAPSSNPIHWTFSTHGLKGCQERTDAIVAAYEAASEVKNLLKADVPDLLSQVISARAREVKNP